MTERFLTEYVIRPGGGRNEPRVRVWTFVGDMGPTFFGSHPSLTMIVDKTTGAEKSQPQVGDYVLALQTWWASPASPEHAALFHVRATFGRSEIPGLPEDMRMLRFEPVGPQPNPYDPESLVTRDAWAAYFTDPIIAAYVNSHTREPSPPSSEPNWTAPEKDLRREANNAVFRFRDLPVAVKSAQDPLQPPQAPAGPAAEDAVKLGPLDTVIRLDTAIPVSLHDDIREHVLRALRGAGYRVGYVPPGVEGPEAQVHVHFRAKSE